MSRRALRDIGKGLDLSACFRELDELPRPLTSAALFGREAPLEVELGSGKGLFLSAAAAEQPETNFLGIEVSLKYARHAAARCAQRALTNACVAHGDGLWVFRELIGPAKLAAVHVYFPDPWWKARHKKRRVMNAAFLADVERTLAPGGTLHFWTDVEEYFQASLETIAASTRLTGPLPVAETPALDDLDYRTHFERRTRLAGLPVYRAEFRRMR
ncbi:MAG TPA: tRNA (guanosine(46)-N7)-methyltransferase TrmB [Pirellulales bacterium]|jgi:tRNA (guanine-N7-)-methyltransferase|nr:tRNA (guanosine(46)-N7)-methyltransferase TrmB [Pirellulales bacterium]